MKIKKTFFYIMMIFVCIVYAIHFFISDEYDTQRLDEINNIFQEDIEKVIIYCEKNTNDVKYKVVINNKKIIEELKNASIFEFGTKSFSGQFDQDYSIQLFIKNGETYMYRFFKKYSPQGDYCKRNIEFKGKLHSNPHNDCGQIAIISKPGMSEMELINDPLPAVVISGYNLKLISFIEKYADNIPFDGENKLPYYNKFDLQKKKNEK